MEEINYKNHYMISVDMSENPFTTANALKYILIGGLIGVAIGLIIGKSLGAF